MCGLEEVVNNKGRSILSGPLHGAPVIHGACRLPLPPRPLREEFAEVLEVVHLGEHATRAQQHQI